MLTVKSQLTLLIW